MEPRPAKYLAWVIAAISGCALIFAFGSYRFYQAQRDDLIKVCQGDLDAIAEMKATALANWRRHRFADIRIAAENPFLLETLAGLYPPAPDAVKSAELLAWLESFHLKPQYSGAALVDSSGRILLSAGLTKDEQEHVGGHVAARGRIDETLFLDFHQLTEDVPPHLSLYNPLGASFLLYLQIDPRGELYRLIQDWPTSSPSGEVLLVRREGDEVLFLNELRHRTGTALRLRAPTTLKTLPAVRGATGHQGALEGVDYRGVEVLAATRRVPDSPWFVVVKIDRAEVLASLQARGLVLAAFAFLVSALVATLVLLAWRFKRAEALRLRLADSERHREEMQRVAADLRRSNEELGQFAYIASHDLQEPLRSIASFLQLVERRYGERLDDKGVEFIHFAVDGANRLQSMIEGLLAYSRVGSQPFEPVPVDLGRALEKALANLEVSITEAGAAVTSDPLPTVPGHESLFVQLFQNLVGNAVKHCGAAAPLIHVSCVQGPQGPVVKVRDNGIGIAPEHQERIFEIFRRLEGPAVPGSGIGLALCRRIVERAGGQIWVESEPGSGATFAFTFPENREVASTEKQEGGAVAS